MTLSVINKDAEQTFPIKANMDIIRNLQEHVAPEIFTPRCVYDGRKNLFSIRRLPFGDERRRTVSIDNIKDTIYNLLSCSSRSPGILPRLPRLRHERQGLSRSCLQKLQRSIRSSFETALTQTVSWLTRFSTEFSDVSC